MICVSYRLFSLVLLNLTAADHHIISFMLPARVERAMRHYICRRNRTYIIRGHRPPCQLAIRANVRSTGISAFVTPQSVGLCSSHSFGRSQERPEPIEGAGACSASRPEATSSDPPAVTVICCLIPVVQSSFIQYFILLHISLQTVFPKQIQ
jgi:hypothetical protein